MSTTPSTLDCTPACEAAPACTVCHRPKRPHGRSVSPEREHGLCGLDCSGYALAPRAGHLWPGELKDVQERQRAGVQATEIRILESFLVHAVTGTSDVRCRGDHLRYERAGRQFELRVAVIEDDA